MRLRFPDGWVDFDLNLFTDVAHLVDARLDEIEEVAKTHPGLADGLDYPLRHEHLLGIGFLAAQSYLSIVIAEEETPRREALSVGPRHGSGIALAQLIYHVCSSIQKLTTVITQKLTTSSLSCVLSS